MDFFKNLVENYEKYLQEHLVYEHGKYGIDKFYFIFEKRGVNFTFKEIADTMYNCIGNFGWIKTKDNALRSQVTNIYCDNTFLGDFELNVYLYPPNKAIKDKASVNIINAEYDTDDKKLYNVVFNYYWYKNKEINSLEFKKSMWHELQHAYRYYADLKYEYENKDKHEHYFSKEDTMLDHYYNALEVDETTDSIVNIGQIYYFTNNNEINSYMASMYPYLEKHTEINFNNFKDYLNNIPGYQVINILKDFSYNFGGFVENPFHRQIVGKQCRKIFDNNQLTDVEAIKKTRRRLHNALLYAEKQFYKTLVTSLEHLNRKRKFNECLILT